MKNTFLALVLLLSYTTFGQTHTWHPLPDAPLVQGPGSNAARAGDVSIAEDGRIYTAYMFDDGFGIKLYIDEYITGTGWTTIYNENTYAVFQTIKSRKNGNSIYFMVYMSDSFGNPVWKTYLVTNGTATQYSTFLLPGYQTTTGVDFEMGTNPSYGYLLYMLSSGTGLQISRVDYGSNTVTSQTVTLPNSELPSTFDMTVAGDSVFMAIAVQNPSYKAYFLKTGPLANVIVPYLPSAVNGEIFNPGTVSSNTFLINSDGISKVHISAYDFGNIASMERIYENGVLSPATYIGTIPENYSLGATAGVSDNMFLFNNYSPSNAGPYSTYVVTHKLSTNVFDTIGTPGSYVLATNSPTEHRMSYSENKKRFAVSFYDPTLLKRSYYLTNSVPYLDQNTLNQTPQLCEGQSNTIFGNFGIIDDNLDVVTILEIQSSDLSIIDPINAGFTPLGSNAFSLYAMGTIPGSVTLSIKVTDGMDTVVLVLPTITVVSSNPPAYNVSSVEVCSGQEEIDLNDFVSLPGGNFYENMLEIGFPGGIFDTDNSPLTAETAFTLSYDYNDGICFYTITTPITYHISPNVSITQTPTVCNGNTGTASALVSGGATPYQLSQWSSGEQNLNNVNNLAAGQYSYTLIDANNCTVNKYFEIVTSGTDATAAITNVACNGQTNGAITLTPVGLTAPLTVIWSSGHSTLNLSGVPAGNYTVNITDATGCSLSKTFVITEPSPLTTQIIETFTTCQASTGAIDVDVTTGGTAPYTYAWSNGDTGPTTANLPWGIYSLTTTDANNCITVNTSYISELGGGFIYGTVTGTNCGAATGAIDTYPDVPAGETVTAIDWSNGATTEDITDLLPDLYICTLSLSNNCHAIKGWDLPVVKPLRNDICVVTVDSATTTNLVVWEPVQPVGISYYKIYRETSIQGEYALIDTVQATNLSLFNDVVASPLSRSWRYKISAVNACEVEGPLSAAHQTIHLDVIDNGGVDVTVNWNAYEGAAFSNYIVSRYTDANGWEVVATVPTNLFSYTDNTPITTLGLDYMVEIQLDATCTAVVWRAQDFNSARSNKEKGQFSTGNGTGDSNNGIDELYLDGITVAPNPTDGMLTISQLDARKMNMEVRSIDGQLLHKSTISALETQFDMNDYSKGIYFITFNLNAVRQTIRIVKQ
ncbi:MAG: T9SS type A sorting domain-containing protein [Flavobacteriia bacterium]|nr:T9SS type A sorting domain-containing protein [Flavobacteriia bacterium]